MNHWSLPVNVRGCFVCRLPSLKLTFSHLKMDGWNTSFLLGQNVFSGANC